MNIGPNRIIATTTDQTSKFASAYNTFIASKVASAPKIDQVANTTSASEQTPNSQIINDVPLQPATNADILTEAPLPTANSIPSIEDIVPEASYKPEQTPVAPTIDTLANNNDSNGVATEATDELPPLDQKLVQIINNYTNDIKTAAMVTIDDIKEASIGAIKEYLKDYQKDNANIKVEDSIPSESAANLVSPTPVAPQTAPMESPNMFDVQPNTNNQSIPDNVVPIGNIFDDPNNQVVKKAA